MWRVIWEEWAYLFYIGLFITVSLIFMITAFRRGHMGDPVCTKFNVFNGEAPTRAKEEPKPPLYCQLSYLERPPWWQTGWVRIVLLVWFAWLALVLGAFIASHLLS